MSNERLSLVVAGRRGRGLGGSCISFLRRFPRSAYVGVACVAVASLGLYKLYLLKRAGERDDSSEAGDNPGDGGLDARGRSGKKKKHWLEHERGGKRRVRGGSSSSPRMRTGRNRRTSAPQPSRPIASYGRTEKREDEELIKSAVVTNASQVVPLAQVPAEERPVHVTKTDEVQEVPPKRPGSAEKTLEQDSGTEEGTEVPTQITERETRELSLLEQLGYHFVNGKLLQIKNGRPFEFVDQMHYELLGQAITAEVYTMMLEVGLVPIEIPLGGGNGPRTEIFASTRIRDSLSGGGDMVAKVLILIHGSGAVRAGQWARSLIINEHVDLGTMIPYIKKGLEKGYDIIVTNGNDAAANRVRDNETSSSHGTYVWQKIIGKLHTRMVALVAHSAGGYVTVKMASDNEDFQERVFAIAFTDSAHGWIPESSRNFFKRVGRNWVTSNKPLGETLREGSVREVSAGHTRHEWTSGIAFPDVFSFLELREGKIVEERRDMEKRRFEEQSLEKEKRFSGSSFVPSMQAMRWSGHFVENGHPEVPEKPDEHERKRVNGGEVLSDEDSVTKKMKLQETESQTAVTEDDGKVIEDGAVSSEDEGEHDGEEDAAVQPEKAGGENGEVDGNLDGSNLEGDGSLNQPKIEPRQDEDKENLRDQDGKVEVNGEKQEENGDGELEDRQDALDTSESVSASGFSADEENSSSLHDEM